ncbi:iron chelate uptake ABC transporter family permease subunit [Micromonospora sp. WMMD1082]|uniref:FecCD family ABC transporter permease n=1 Tax=Micromonospora sp. WMMD1082 TaxID=3016104 RepID=UPI002416A351|nr:iron chelate uptake ABC transporter family permease subunit [Micromonospora sp. WMMD1082]MDG4795652.1 iron chelate uptake ABC transporter family permease subunit [Micromonospora sp. WMMD1082]
MTRPAPTTSSPPPRPGPADTVAAAARAVVRATRRRGRARSAGVTITLAVVAAALFCTALAVGAVAIPLPDVLDTLFAEGSRRDEFVISDVRLPRVLTGLLAGAAFGLSGAIFQSLVRNPLASPDIIGITMGASAAAVVCIIVFGVVGAVVSVSAFAGALGTAALIYLLAWRDGITGYRLVLVGIGVAAVLASVVSYLMSRAEITSAQQALVWLTGSLNARSWAHVQPLALTMAVLLPCALGLSRELDVLRLGDATAVGLGARVERLRLAILLTGVALAAVATAAAGPVPFVAFVAAPIARRLVRDRGPALLPAALTGATIMVAADLTAQHVLGSGQFPVGVVTGVVGAPYLLWLLATANRAGRGG